MLTTPFVRITPFLATLVTVITSCRIERATGFSVPHYCHYGNQNVPETKKSCLSLSLSLSSSSVLSIQRQRSIASIMMTRTTTTTIGRGRRTLRSSKARINDDDDDDNDCGREKKTDDYNGGNGGSIPRKNGMDRARGRSRRETLMRISVVTMSVIPFLSSSAVRRVACALDTDQLQQQQQDLTSQLFNPDGSLRDETTSREVTFRTVTTIFPSFADNEDAVLSFCATNSNAAGAAALVSRDGGPVQLSSINTNTDDNRRCDENWNRGTTTNKARAIRVTYQLPDKYGDKNYVDSTAGGVDLPALNRITVFSPLDGIATTTVMGNDDKSKGRKTPDITSSAAASASSKQATLEKATSIGIAKTLQIDTLGEGNYNPTLFQADVVGGRKRKSSSSSSSSAAAAAAAVNTNYYYDFDLAVAPESCAASSSSSSSSAAATTMAATAATTTTGTTLKNNDNLGLGFCPYDSVVLLSATTVVNQRQMFVFMLECNREEWKRNNVDLKRIRSSFMVEEI